MRKLLTLLSVAVLTVGSFVACSSDSDKTPALADKVKGDYKVSIEVPALFEGVMGEGKVVLAKKTKNTVSLKLEGFKFGDGDSAIEIPVALQEAQLKEGTKENTVTITSEEFTIDLPDALIPVGGEEGEIPAKKQAKVKITSGLINLAASPKNIDLTISVKADLPGMQDGVSVLAKPIDR